MKFYLTAFILLSSAMMTIGYCQEKMALYPGKIPDSIDAGNKESIRETIVFAVSQPELSIFLPDNKNTGRTAVIICPGGGYGVLCIQTEGYDIAKKYNQLGVAAFVLKYRLPSDRTSANKAINPLQDAQQAIKLVRENAAKWGIDPLKIGIMGFSAGGHLASTAGTHFNQSFIPNENSVSLRPDFMVLVYPVISMQAGLTHFGSKENLLGKAPLAITTDLFSNEKQITSLTPPTFLIHAGDDDAVMVENSLRFYEALKANHIPAGMHIYPTGKHGFPLEPAKSTWFDYCARWMKEQKLIEKETNQ
jgi:acetyl esterase/lipase